MKVLGIRRGLKYSPNLVGNDAAIFTAVMDELRAEGHEVSTIREEEMLAQDYGAYDRVVTMARSMATLSTLMDDLKEREDVPAFAPASVPCGRMCRRSSSTRSGALWCA